MEIKTPKGYVSKMQACRHCGAKQINSIGLCKDCNRACTFVTLQKNTAKKDGIELMQRVQERKARLLLEYELYKSMEDAINNNDGIGKPTEYMKYFVDKY